MTAQRPTVGGGLVHKRESRRLEGRGSLCQYKSPLAEPGPQVVTLG